MHKSTQNLHKSVKNPSQINQHLSNIGPKSIQNLWKSVKIWSGVVLAGRSAQGRSRDAPRRDYRYNLSTFFAKNGSPRGDCCRRAIPPHPMDLRPLEGKAIESEKAAETNDSSTEESHNQMQQILKNMKNETGRLPKWTQNPSKSGLECFGRRLGHPSAPKTWKS